MIKSWNHENVQAALNEGTWATQVQNEEIFAEAYKNSRHVIFFFSVNNSKAFQGYVSPESLSVTPSVKYGSALNISLITVKRREWNRYPVLLHNHHGCRIYVGHRVRHSIFAGSPRPRQDLVVSVISRIL